MSELQAEGRHLVGKAELVSTRPNARNRIGAHAGPDQLDRAVEPVAALLVGVVLRRGGAPDVEGAVVASAVAHEGLQHVEERLVAGADHAVGEIVRVRIAALPGNGVDRLDVVGAVLVQKLGRHRDDVGLAHARLELLADQLVDAVDHGGGAIEQRNLVDALDLASVEHDLLAVRDLEPGALELEHHRRFDDVDAERHVGDAGFPQESRDLLRVAPHQAECRGHGPAQADQPGLAKLRP